MTMYFSLKISKWNIFFLCIYKYSVLKIIKVIESQYKQGGVTPHFSAGKISRFLEQHGRHFKFESRSFNYSVPKE